MTAGGSFLDRRNDHDDGTAVQNGRLIRLPEFLERLEKTAYRFLTQGQMAHFPASEAQNDADLVAVAQKASGMVELRLEIVHVDAVGKLYFLLLDDLLLLFGFLFLLLALKAEFCRNP